MADASCGGSTPFKSLVDHQNRNNSHHQDRLVDRTAGQSPASFRSHPGYAADQAQDGFGAFINGPSPATVMHADPAGRLAAHAAALDQRNMSIHAHGLPQGPAQAGPSQQTPLSAVPGVPNWAAEFRAYSPTVGHQSTAHSAPMQSSQAAMNQQHFQPSFQAAFGPLGGGFAPFGGPMHQVQPPGNDAEFQQEMSRWMANNSAGRMEDVDKAMEDMARELELNDAQLAEPAQPGNAEETSLERSHLTDLEPPEISNLSIDTREEPPLEPPEEPRQRSEVSELAGRLLETVQHEDGDKWKKSAFLSLMRDFRDGKKDIVGNEVLETKTESAALQPTTD